MPSLILVVKMLSEDSVVYAQHFLLIQNADVSLFSQFFFSFHEG